MFETCRVAQFPLTADQELPFPDWEMYIKVGPGPGVLPDDPQLSDAQASPL